MNFELTFTTAELDILQAALIELPFKVAAPLINNLNEQIQRQQRQEPRQQEMVLDQD